MPDRSSASPASQGLSEWLRTRYAKGAEPSPRNMTLGPVHRCRERHVRPPAGCSRALVRRAVRRRAVAFISIAPRCQCCRQTSADRCTRPITSRHRHQRLRRHIVICRRSPASRLSRAAGAWSSSPGRSRSPRAEWSTCGAQRSDADPRALMAWAGRAPSTAPARPGPSTSLLPTQPLALGLLAGGLGGLWLGPVAGGLFAAGARLPRVSLLAGRLPWWGARRMRLPAPPQGTAGAERPVTAARRTAQDGFSRSPTSLRHARRLRRLHLRPPENSRRRFVFTAFTVTRLLRHLVLSHLPDRLGAHTWRRAPR